MVSLAPLDDNLDQQKAAHLLRRASFKYNHSRLSALVGMSVSAAVDSLLNIDPLNLPPLVSEYPNGSQAFGNWIEGNGTDTSGQLGNKRTYITGWWLYEMMQEDSILMKMAWFLHSNFTASYAVTSTELSLRQFYTHFYYDHLILLRNNALGNAKSMARSVTLDNLMLLYLNNTKSEVGNPDENYARELMELFTIGAGNYTQADVVAAARLLTGFKARSITSSNQEHADPSTHDFGQKVFSSYFNNQVIHNPNNTGSVADMHAELDEFIDMIFNHPEMPKFTCRKIYRFFVCSEITTEVETVIISELAQLFSDPANFSDENGQFPYASYAPFSYLPVLDRLLKSQHFYGVDQVPAQECGLVIGGKVKSPLDLFTQVFTAFDFYVPYNTHDFYTQFSARFIRDVYFTHTQFFMQNPLDVSGYPGYSQAPEWDNLWFNGSSIIPRYQLGWMLFRSQSVYGAISHSSSSDIVLFVQDTIVPDAGHQAHEIVQWLANYLFPEPPVAEVDGVLFYDPDGNPTLVNGEPICRLGYLLFLFLQGASAACWAMDWTNYVTGVNTDSSVVRIPLEDFVIALLESQESQLM